jgi:hypothetical protein
MDKNQYERLLREFRGGDISLAKEVLDESLRRGAFDEAQQALDTMRSGVGKVPYFMRTEFQEGRILSYLRGPKGAIQFMAMLLPGLEGGSPLLGGFRMTGTDVGVHSLEPLYEGMQVMGECPILDGAQCYYDGSGLRAMEELPRIVQGGQEYLREFLEAEYEAHFEA